MGRYKRKKMLLWRRNVKISHYTVGVGPIETGLLYVILSGLVCLLGPVLLTLYGNDFYNNAETRFLTPKVAYARESVLVISDANDDLWIYSSSNNENTNLACSHASNQVDQRISQLMTCSVENVVSFELYTYFAYSMSGLASPLVQLHQIASSSFRASMGASIDARSTFTQSSQLLPLANEAPSSSPAYLPSRLGDGWTSSEARANHTRRSVRFDAQTVTERWQGGSDALFQLEVNFDFPDVLVAREQKLWNKIKYYFVQLLAFLIAFCFCVNKLNSYLFESNMFTTFMRIETAPNLAAKAS